MTARNKTQGSQPAITCTEWVRKPYDALRDYVKCSGPEREPVHTRISNTTAHDTTDQGRTGRENMSLDSTRLPCAEAVRALSTRENGGAERNPVCPLHRARRVPIPRAPAGGPGLVTATARRALTIDAGGRASVYCQQRSVNLREPLP